MGERVGEDQDGEKQSDRCVKQEFIPLCRSQSSITPTKDQADELKSEECESGGAAAAGQQENKPLNELPTSTPCPEEVDNDDAGHEETHDDDSDECESGGTAATGRPQPELPSESPNNTTARANDFESEDEGHEEKQSDECGGRKSGGTAAAGRQESELPTKQPPARTTSAHKADNEDENPATDEHKSDGRESGDAAASGQQKPQLPLEPPTSTSVGEEASSEKGDEDNGGWRIPMLLLFV